MLLHFIQGDRGPKGTQGEKGVKGQEGPSGEQVNVIGNEVIVWFVEKEKVGDGLWIDCVTKLRVGVF